MNKLLSWIIMALTLTTVGLAATYSVMQNGSYYILPLWTNTTFTYTGNVTANYVNANSSWTHQSYPAACPSSSAITQLGDSITCTDGLYTYVQMAANIGNWSADKPSYALDSRVTTVNATVNSLGNYSANGLPKAGGIMSGDLIIDANILVRLTANTSTVICNVTNAGGIYYNGGDFKHYGCNSTDWNAMY